ncbi:PepSY domain-containing protein [Fulvivirga maritima]|uniref:PepSY domain-containing protein n=1 Tax=Fulvivirga maritima TaxID=2904247 RepID=UPI001F37E50B|nr:PepSY domain-containing protein [Fulvivirga maritima]UII25371.1 PepSY domain-containing protein [Fulvivirga maritima]
MRKILLLVLILAPCLHGFSQGKKDKPDTTGSSSQRSTPPKGSKKNQHLFSNSNQSKTTETGKFRTLNNRTDISEKELRNTLKLPQEVTLKSVNTTTDKQGFRHETLQQYYKNLPIIGYQIFKHSKKNLILQGETPKIKELEVKPAFSAEDAIAKAKTHLKVTETLNDYPAELKILRNSDKEFVLVYEVRIDAAKPLTMKKVFIDAKSGKPIKTLNLIAHADTPATAHTLYSGIKNITTDS